MRRASYSASPSDAVVTALALRFSSRATQRAATVRACPTPTVALVLAPALEGSASPAIVNRVHDGLAARVPQAQRVVVMGAGHMSPLSHPDNVAAEIGNFLKV